MKEVFSIGIVILVDIVKCFAHVLFTTHCIIYIAPRLRTTIAKHITVFSTVTSFMGRYSMNEENGQVCKTPNDGFEN